jgi:hypothetical protein
VPLPGLLRAPLLRAVLVPLRALLLRRLHRDLWQCSKRAL